MTTASQTTIGKVDLALQADARRRKWDGALLLVATAFVVLAVALVTIGLWPPRNGLHAKPPAGMSAVQ